MFTFFKNSEKKKASNEAGNEAGKIDKLFAQRNFYDWKLSESIMLGDFYLADVYRVLKNSVQKDIDSCSFI